MRDVTEARCGMLALSHETALNGVSDILPENRKPYFKKMLNVLKTTGFEVGITTEEGEENAERTK